MIILMIVTIFIIKLHVVRDVDADKHLVKNLRAYFNTLEKKGFFVKHLILQYFDFDLIDLKLNSKLRKESIGFISDSQFYKWTCGIVD
jgi:hypothetical protein